MLWGRIYFGVQALAGAAWWVAVALVPIIRTATLGTLDPVPVAVLDVPLFVLASAAAALGMRWAAGVAAIWTTIVAAALAIYATVTTEAGWGAVIMVGAAGASIVAALLVARGRLPTEWIVTGVFAPRPAAPGGRHGLMTTLQIVVFWGTCLGVIPLVIVALEHRWQLALPWAPAVSVIGIVMLVLASALGIWTAVSMTREGRGTPLPAATATRLVTTGPYSVVRNPMAIAGIAQGVAVGIALGSWLVVLYALAGSLVWNYAIRPHEEADLELRFGAEFRRYSAEVRCWVPRIRPSQRADLG